jgi:hypothetical protein
MQGFRLLAMAAMLLAAVSTSTASANPLPNDQEPRAANERKGGNAIDKSAGKPATPSPSAGRSSLPPAAYEEMAEFWALFLASGSYDLAGYVRGTGGADPDTSIPPLELITRPEDGPAESILDALDESQAAPVLVGEPGSATPAAGGGGAQPATAGTGASSGTAGSGGAPTPPDETIMDYLDQASTPTPAPSTAQDAAKPAANQATRPATTPSKR